MAKMRCVQVSTPKGPFELVERDIPEPRAGAVRIKVQACGICHSDVYTKEGLFPGIRYPRVPGHEIAGVIDSVTLTSAGAAATADVGTGSYAITPSAATGAAFKATNYNITYVSGTLTVNPAVLTVTANSPAPAKTSSSPRRTAVNPRSRWPALNTSSPRRTVRRAPRGSSMASCWSSSFGNAMLSVSR